VTPVPARLLRLPEVRLRVGGLSKVALWRMRRQGRFPEPVRLSAGAVAWLESEIDNWIAVKVADRDRKGAAR